MNSYKSYSTFRELESAELQAYNRAITAVNIKDDLGMDQCTRYCKQFTSEEHKNMLVMLLSMEEQTQEEVKKQIMRNMNVH